MRGSLGNGGWQKDCGRCRHYFLCTAGPALFCYFLRAQDAYRVLLRRTHKDQLMEPISFIQPRIRQLRTFVSCFLPLFLLTTTFSLVVKMKQRFSSLDIKVFLVYSVPLTARLIILPGYYSRALLRGRQPTSIQHLRPLLCMFPSPFDQIF